MQQFVESHRTHFFVTPLFIHSKRVWQSRPQRQSVPKDPDVAFRDLKQLLAPESDNIPT